jgi:amino acid transporter
MKTGFTLVIFSLILFPAALWGLAWYFSSAHVAAEFCKGDFSLFHEHIRCQKPHIALLISVISAVISFFILGMGAKKIRKISKEQQ